MNRYNYDLTSVSRVLSLFFSLFLTPLVQSGLGTQREISRGTKRRRPYPTREL
jgi:hypothetical protein